jgi:hypothetical protein
VTKQVLALGEVLQCCLKRKTNLILMGICWGGEDQNGYLGNLIKMGNLIRIILILIKMGNLIRIILILIKMGNLIRIILILIKMGNLIRVSGEGGLDHYRTRQGRRRRARLLQDKT